MNTKLFSVAVAAVAGLALGTTAQAVTIFVTPDGSPTAGAQSLILTADAGAGNTVGSIGELNVTGEVHQVWQNTAAGQGRISPVEGSLTPPTAVFGNADWEALDTHFLIDPNSADSLLSPGFGLSESNGEGDPLGVEPLIPSNSAFSGFPGSAGFGSLTMTGTAPQVTVAAEARQQLQPFLQLVIPASYVQVEDASLAAVTVDLFTIDGATDTMEEHTLYFGIPEPSSLALIGLGGLALIRRRTA